MLSCTANDDWNLTIDEDYYHYVAKNDKASLNNINLKYGSKYINTENGSYISLHDVLFKYSNDKTLYSAWIKSNVFHTYKYRATYDKTTSTYSFYELSDKEAFSLE